MKYLPSVLIAAIIFYVFSFYSYRNKKYVPALVYIIAAGFIIRLFCSLDFYLHEWDERFHALIVKHILEHPLTPTLFDNPVLNYNINNWAGNHIWLSKPLLPFWVMAPFIKLFGNNEIALRIPSLIFSTALIFITYLIAKELFNKKVAVISAFLASIHGMLIESAAGIASSDHVDTLFIFNVAVSILFMVYYVKRGNKPYFFLLSILFAVLAFYSKWIVAFMIFPIIAILLLYHLGTKKGMVASLIWLLLFLLLSAPLPLVMWHLFPKEFSLLASAIFKPINTVVQGHDGGWYYYIQQAGIFFNELIYIPLIVIFYKWLKGRKNISRLLIMSWIIIPVLLFSLSSTKRNTYLLFCAPAFFILSSYFIVSLPVLLKKYSAKKYVPAFMILYLLISVRYGIERIKPFKDKNPLWSQEIKSLASTLPQDSCIIFNAKQNIELMFYSNSTAYNYIPDIDVLNKLHNEGYKLYIVNKETLPPETANIEYIKYIKLPDSE